ncbi:hypothetical protein NLI96_g7245 [Meripilus lineatus]|uniref:Uncharacterized protein n=1 Tax=Meripilus lineatus TaxID=2056292 RepID=A0AAD5V4A5_9APHY|nr:hypothetical protein NLI96_g7245 [Physisporinus lineatus]
MSFSPHTEASDNTRDSSLPTDPTSQSIGPLPNDTASSSMASTGSSSVFEATSPMGWYQHRIEISHESLLSARRNWEKAFHLALILATLCFAAFAVPFFGETHPLVFFVCFGAICAFMAVSSTYILPHWFQPSANSPYPVS